MESELLKALAVTAELTHTEISAEAARVLAQDLKDYDPQAVLNALTRCRRELRGTLTLAAIIERIDDGRPGPEEAWAMLPRSEDDTVVWTDEMSEAFFAGAAMLMDTDPIAARMAFKEVYTKLLVQSRTDGKVTKWQVSLGHDKAGRATAITQAVEKGRLTQGYAAKLLPSPENSGNRNGGMKRITSPLKTETAK